MISETDQNLIERVLFEYFLVGKRPMTISLIT
jgi:hypothetical protein